MDSPSLTNSHSRGYDLKLRRTDQALHDTTKSFVESLSHDIRISQHADLVYACKRMETEKSFWLQPLTGGGQARPGYLVFLPRQPVIWIDEQFKQSFRIPIRVSFQIYERKSVFIASLDRTDGLLRIEDCWLLSGDSLKGKAFTERWDNVITFFDTKYKPDPTLQQGLRIEPAVYESLISAKKWVNVPNMVLLQGDAWPRRLRVYFKEKDEHQQERNKVTPLTPIKTPSKQFVFVKKELIKPLFVNDNNETSPNAIQENKAIAVPHDDYPDTYNLFIGGVKKGYAAVQDLALSKDLRSAFSKVMKKELLVNIEWNEEFKMFQINSLA